MLFYYHHSVQRDNMMIIYNSNSSFGFKVLKTFERWTCRRPIETNHGPYDKKSLLGKTIVVISLL